MPPTPPAGDRHVVAFVPGMMRDGATQVVAVRQPDDLAGSAVVIGASQLGKVFAIPTPGAQWW